MSKNIVEFNQKMAKIKRVIAEKQREEKRISYKIKRLKTELDEEVMPEEECDETKEAKELRETRDVLATNEEEITRLTKELKNHEESLSLHIQRLFAEGREEEIKKIKDALQTLYQNEDRVLDELAEADQTLEKWKNLKEQHKYALTTVIVRKDAFQFTHSIEKFRHDESQNRIQHERRSLGKEMDTLNRVLPQRNVLESLQDPQSRIHQIGLLIKDLTQQLTHAEKRERLRKNEFTQASVKLQQQEKEHRNDYLKTKETYRTTRVHIETLEDDLDNIRNSIACLEGIEKSLTEDQDKMRPKLK